VADTNVKPIIRPTVLWLLLLLYGCKPPEEQTYASISRSETLAPTGDALIHVSTSGNVELSYTLNNLAGRDVYFVFTNMSTTETAANPEVSGGAKRVRTAGVTRSLLSPTSQALLRDKPAAALFNSDVSGYLRSVPNRALVDPINLPLVVDTVSDQAEFFDDLGNTLWATCRVVTDDGTGQFLSIWVEDAQWTDTGEAGKVTQTMVDDLAANFLAGGADNDIYDWVTTVYGAQWGGHAEANLIGPSQWITILLLDIDDGGSGGTVVGFYYSKDSFIRSVATGTPLDYSNQRVMFYLDAPVMVVNQEETLATLAHELQHMIHFYQKTVLLSSGIGSETWLDEMCSLVAEDLLAEKLAIQGPRGVSSSVGGAGASDNTAGRLPLFNLFNDISVLRWNQRLEDYAIVFAFGAYLARNYGGGALFQKIVQNPQTDYRAIETALSALGENASVGTLLRRWAASVLLSDRTNMATAYRYNIGDWFVPAVPPFDSYRLGSIDLWNYRYGSQVGPFLYLSEPIGYAAGHAPASNLYYLAGKRLAGSHSWSIRIPGSVKLTAVVKSG
jgi:hypothetical protein